MDVAEVNGQRNHGLGARAAAATPASTGEADVSSVVPPAEVLSTAECDAERRLAVELRGRERDQRKRAGLAAVRRAGREQRAADRLARLELSDRVWHQRALSTRRRLTSPDARLAQLARVHRATTATLLGVAGAGIAWASVNVQHTLTHTLAGGHLSANQPLWWLSFAVEPLVSVPLVVLLAVRGTASRWGRSFGSRGVRAVEAVLLLITTALNAAPYLSSARTPAGVAVLLGHLIAPAMVATAVILQPIVGGFLANVLVEAHVEASDTGRMSDEAAEFVELLARIRTAMAEGVLSPAEGSEWPSISAIQRYLAVGKQRAQAAHDALVRLGRAGR